MQCLSSRNYEMSPSNQNEVYNENESKTLRLDFHVQTANVYTQNKANYSRNDKLHCNGDNDLFTSYKISIVLYANIFTFIK